MNYSAAYMHKNHNHLSPFRKLVFAILQKEPKAGKTYSDKEEVVKDYTERILSNLNHYREGEKDWYRFNRWIRVIVLRFGLRGEVPLTCEEIAKSENRDIPVSHQQILALEKQALTKLRGWKTLVKILADEFNDGDLGPESIGRRYRNENQNSK